MIKNPTEEKNQHVNTYSNVELVVQAVRKVNFPEKGVEQQGHSLRCGN